MTPQHVDPVAGGSSLSARGGPSPRRPWAGITRLELLVQVLLSHLAWSYTQPQGSSGKSKLQLNPEGSCKSLSERGGKKPLSPNKANEMRSENSHRWCYLKGWQGLRGEQRKKWLPLLIR